MRSMHRIFLSAVCGLLLSGLPELCHAQDAVVVPSGVRGRRSTPSQPGQPGQPQPGQAKPGDKSKPGDDKNKDKKPDEKKEEPGTSAVKRPAKPDEEPKPEDLKLQRLGDGEVRFNFRGAPWPVVLKELADVAHLNLDWQELPGDYLNFVTTRSYEVDEARDVINRHLLARGYTMILHEEMLSVVSLKKIKELNPAVVPEVTPEELAKLMPHEYVRTSFVLDTLIAKELAEQLKPLISPEHGRLNAVESLNRLEAMDTVANLRQIQSYLLMEKSDIGQDRVMQEFFLKHTRASETLVQLQDLLGIKRTAEVSGAANPQMQQQMQQMMQRMQQQQQKKGGAAGAKAPEEVRLIVNSRSNSIMATAPPNKMAIITQAIKSLDVAADPADSLFNNIDRMQTYRLAATDPETLVNMLEDLGGLDIGTQLEVDKKNKAIIAKASMTDHLMIRKLIAKLDGSGRRFDVIKLRRLDAVEVAGSIKFMMGGEEEKKDNSRSRYSWYGGYGSSNQKEEKEDKFRVDADMDNNRLLLWANDIELDSVEGLLVKLGEIRAPGQNRSKMRLMEAVSPEDSEKVLERLRKIWPNIAPNELILPEPIETPETDEPTKEKKDAAAKPKTAALPIQPRLQLANFYEEKTAAKEPVEAAAADASDNQQAKRPAGTRKAEAPPISIRRTHDGRLVISCDDPAALDVLEDLMVDIAPPPKTYKVFFLKYASAYWVSFNLEDFFKEEDEDDKPRRPYWYYDYGSNDKKDETRSLSKRKKLKFIVDTDTNSIMVRGGDSSQWKTVEELIEMYDKALPPNSRNVRHVQIFKLKHNSAKDVSEAIKDVYRDLLSANDKALENQPKKQTNIRYADYYGDDDKDELSQGRFKGDLSIGVDPKTNTLIVSATEAILHNVGLMINELETSAAPLESNMQVVKLKPGMDSAAIHENLSKLLNPRPSDEEKQRQEAEKQKQMQRKQQQQQQDAAAAALLN
ncbi:Bacterial type II/III secretion system short domain protein [Symmachiella macrocystis]|uniref:Bacterial type II/III secretion system short domain protein n=1 Tax=Symmachiella macrocystis TaxID=2527985 RepID=A0A5C6BQV3_9PLAN|nr:secretin N-terminal domain-containing protein [Symmachiella macrocystis]TWU14092.1 Bacterial type II/III secretion system short domain protein [Symmachiella macrocystis]